MGGNSLKANKREFKEGRRVTVRMGHKRFNFNWYEGTYLYKKGLYHFVELDNNQGIVGTMNDIKEIRS
jgi:hypothetical protein